VVIGQLLMFGIARSNQYSLAITSCCACRGDHGSRSGSTTLHEEGKTRTPSAIYAEYGNRSFELPQERGIVNELLDLDAVMVCVTFALSGVASALPYWKVSASMSSVAAASRGSFR
jgi:hypothetical protein